MSNVATGLDRAEILAWRSDERVRIRERVAERRESLSTELADIVSKATLTELTMGGRFMRNRILPRIAEWADDLEAELRTDIISAAEASEVMHDDISESQWGDLVDVVRFGIGAAISAAPLAAIPFVAAAATVTVTSFVVFSTVTYSPVVLTAAAVGAAAAGFAGGTVRDRAVERRRTRLAERAEAALDKIINGGGDTSQGVLPRALSSIDALTQARLDMTC